MADATGAPPAGDVGAGPAVPNDPWAKTPEQATARLDQMSAEYAAREAPAPTAEQIQDARDAETLLASRIRDDAWMRRYQNGSPRERAEYQQLQQAIADGADQTGQARVGEVETTVGPHGVRRADLIGWIDRMSKVGIPEEGIIRTLNGDFSDEDVEWAQGELDRLMATPEWRTALLSGDPTALHQWTAWCAVISSRKNI
jgi:hypothetical protein